MNTRATRTPRRRSVVALGLVLAVLAGFVLRLVDIQVVNAEQLRAESLGYGMQVTRTLDGARGQITDENGAVLAGNAMRYELAVDPANIFNRKVTADGVTAEQRWESESAQIAGILAQDPEVVRGKVRDAQAANPTTRWAQLATGLSTAQYEQLVALQLGYATLDRDPERVYPSGAVAANIVGLVGADGAPLAGLELADNACLQSTPGEERFERGKDNVVIPGTSSSTPAVDGGTLKLTIDADLQWYMQQLIAEQVHWQQANFGTIMVVEVGTGKIRAAAEYPTFDPNDIDASNPADRGSRIFQSSFEPGSTFKPLTAATVIEQAGVTPTSPTVSAGSLETFPGGTQIGDVDPHPVYNYTLTGALVDSSNVATSKFGDMVPQDVRYDYLKRFGVGESNGLGFPGEPESVLHQTPWDLASNFTATFGQSFTVTVPHVASLYQTIANGGVKVPLRLVESCTSADGTVTEPQLAAPTQVIERSTADQVTEMLENVYEQVHNHSTIEVAGYRAATKTGTAQKIDPGTGNYKKGIFYTTMAGFAPADDPKYVVILTLDEPQKNRLSSANAPGWQKAMTQVLKTYHVLPTGQAARPQLPKYK